MDLPIGAWAPDQPDIDSSGAIEALNVTAKVKSYGPFASFNAISEAITARAQGGIFAKKADGGGVIFAGDATKLYSLSMENWTDVTRTSGGPYSVAADGTVEFIQFGPNVISVNGTDDAQTFDIDSDTDFSDLGGSPPIAKHICVAGDFVMMGNVSSFPNRVQWSGINDSADYVPSQVTQSDYQDIPEGGAVQKLVGIDYGALVLQESAIKRANYEGPDLIFRFSLVTANLGCAIPGAVTNYRDLVFNCDRSGFYMIQGAVQITPISDQRVTEWFWGNVNLAYLHRVTAAVDPVNNCYIVSFPDLTSTDGTPNHLACYFWNVDRWTHCQPGALEMIFSGATQTGWTIEQIASAYATIELMPFPWDSVVWSGVARRLVSGFDTSHKLGFFAGSALAATVTTTEASPAKGRLARIRSVRAMIDGGATHSVAIGVRNRQMDPVVFGPDVSVNALGSCPQNTVGRYMRGTVKVPAGEVWTHLMGLDDLDVAPEGRQ